MIKKVLDFMANNSLAMKDWNDCSYGIRFAALLTWLSVFMVFCGFIFIISMIPKVLFFMIPIVFIAFIAAYKPKDT